MFRMTLTALACAMFALPALAEDIDNPLYKSWNHGVGTTVTTKMLTKSGPTTMEMVEITTLKSKTDSEIVLSIKRTMVVMGNKIDQPATEMKIPAKLKKVEGNGEGEKVETKTGEETLEIGGKKVACKWTEVTQNGNTTRVWNSDDVPGMNVKMTIKGTTEVSRVVTAFEIK